MDPIISTQAAAKLLQMNYRQLGSWPLALTAYNHGTAGVSRAVRATGSRDLCTIIERYQSRSFRFASSNFYAQFLAARHVALDKYRDLSVSSSHGRILRPLLAHAQREKTSTE
jgi:membrane-bound lytic murein transglycosylase D